VTFCQLVHHQCTTGLFFEILKDDISRRALVRVAGLEPARPYGQQILSLQRLPFRHTRLENLVYF